MFVCCKKNLHIREGGEVLNLQSGFIGEIDDCWSGHWYIRAALKDGTITAAESPQAAPKETGEPTQPPKETGADNSDREAAPAKSGEEKKPTAAAKGKAEPQQAE